MKKAREFWNDQKNKSVLILALMKLKEKEGFDKKPYMVDAEEIEQTEAIREVVKKIGYHGLMILCLDAAELKALSLLKNCNTFTKADKDEMARAVRDWGKEGTPVSALQLTEIARILF